MIIPIVGRKYTHHNGNIYEVLCIANTDSDRQEKYPTTVVYRGGNGKVWCRKLVNWEGSFTVVEEGASYE